MHTQARAIAAAKTEEILATSKNSGGFIRLVRSELPFADGKYAFVVIPCTVN